MPATAIETTGPTIATTKRGSFSLPVPHPVPTSGISCPVSGLTLSDTLGNPVAAHRPLNIFTIGTRKSQLAIVQTQEVHDLLEVAYPEWSFPILPMSTTGDKVLDVPLSKIGEKSLFTRELEIALHERRVDFVVHSLKDLPTVLPEGMTIGAILKRENPLDAVVMGPRFRDATLASLPQGSVIGTSSVRRSAQLRRAYPHLEFRDVRGNLNTRLAKLDNEDSPFACIILAVAGLRRLGWEHRISEILSPDVSMHAVGQGALGIECRENDSKTLQLLAMLNHKDTAFECVAERALLRTLEGGCSVPIGVSSTWIEGGEGKQRMLRLRGLVASLDGSEVVQAEASAVVDRDEVEAGDANLLSAMEEQATCALGKEVALLLLDKGAGKILQELTAQRA